MTIAPESPWYADSVDVVEWWADPALAYAKGLADGTRLAGEAFDADLVTALIGFLGGGRDLREAIGNAVQALDRKAIRDSWYLDVEAERGRPW